MTNMTMTETIEMIEKNIHGVLVEIHTTPQGDHQLALYNLIEKKLGTTVESIWYDNTDRKVHMRLNDGTRATTKPESGWVKRLLKNARFNRKQRIEKDAEMEQLMKEHEETMKNVDQYLSKEEKEVECEQLRFELEELKTENESLKEENEELKKQVNELKAELETLTTELERPVEQLMEQIDLDETFEEELDKLSSNLIEHDTEPQTEPQVDIEQLAIDYIKRNIGYLDEYELSESDDTTESFIDGLNGQGINTDDIPPYYIQTVYATHEDYFLKVLAKKWSNKIIDDLNSGMTFEHTTDIDSTDYTPDNCDDTYPLVFWSYEYGDGGDDAVDHVIQLMKDLSDVKVTKRKSNIKFKATSQIQKFNI